MSQPAQTRFMFGQFWTAGAIQNGHGGNYPDRRSGTPPLKKGKGNYGNYLRFLLRTRK